MRVAETAAGGFGGVAVGKAGREGSPAGADGGGADRVEQVLAVFDPQDQGFVRSALGGYGLGAGTGWGLSEEGLEADEYGPLAGSQGLGGGAAGGRDQVGRVGEEPVHCGVQLRGVHGAGFGPLRPVQVLLYFADPRQMHQLLELGQQAGAQIGNCLAGGGGDDGARRSFADDVQVIR